MNKTTSETSLNFFESGQSIVINTFGSVVAIIGTVANLFAFRSAVYLPDATSKYLIRYLAIFDSLTALIATVVRQSLYNLIIPQLQVSELLCCNPGLPLVRLSFGSMDLPGCPKNRLISQVQIWKERLSRYGLAGLVVPSHAKERKSMTGHSSLEGSGITPISGVPPDLDLRV